MIFDKSHAIIGPSGKTPFHILFPNKPLYPIEPKSFGCVCFVGDFHPSIIRLDPESTNRVFLEVSRLQKEYGCNCPTLTYLVSIDVTFLEDTSFFSTSVSTNKDEVDDLLVHTNSPTSLLHPCLIPHLNLTLIPNLKLLYYSIYT